MSYWHGKQWNAHYQSTRKGRKEGQIIQTVLSGDEKCLSARCWKKSAERRYGHTKEEGESITKVNKTVMQ